MDQKTRTIFRQLTHGIKFQPNKFEKEFRKLGHVVPERPQQPEHTESSQDDDTDGDESEDGSGSDDETITAEEPISATHKEPEIEDVPVSAKQQHKRAKKHLSEMNILRKKNNVHTKGTDMPDLITDFNQLTSEYDVRDELLQNLLDLKFSEPTPIQMQCWPLMLRNREILATAPTGSGKTAAFLLPIIHSLQRPRALGFRAIIVSPTRELAAQTTRECKALSEGTGLKVHLVDKIDKIIKKFGPKTSQKFDILVTTPNRLVYILKGENPAISLTNVEWLVVDECDRLFEGGKGGFQSQLSVIYKACCGPKIRRAFFSATHADGLMVWCQSNLDNLALVTVGLRNTASEDVEQELVFCGDESGKMFALRDILRKGYEPPCLVFVQTKERARQLFQELVCDNIMVDAIHSDRTQKQREQCVQAFRAKKIWVLICTELMSRGIDFKGVNLVINYDCPPTLVSYIHRIGRTGRAQHKGKAVTFWTVEDQLIIGNIARTIRASGGTVPEWMNNLRRLTLKEKRSTKMEQYRGFINDSAKHKKIETLKRGKQTARHKLKELKEQGDQDSSEAKEVKDKLFQSINSLKDIEKKEGELDDRKQLKTKKRKWNGNKEGDDKQQKFKKRKIGNSKEGDDKQQKFKKRNIGNNKEDGDKQEKFKKRKMNNNKEGSDKKDTFNKRKMNKTKEGGDKPNKNHKKK